MTDLYKEARVAEQAAYAAGTHLQASRSRLAATLITGATLDDVVDEIDHEIRALIRDVVLRRFPEHGFVDATLDDGSEPPPRRDPNRPHWVVEPLDGVASYLRGHPRCAVSIALVRAGEPLLGVVYDPFGNEFFGAIRGKGAVLNGQAIRCAPPHPPREAVAATVYPKPASARLPTHMAELARVLRGFGGVRRSGSLALETAYLAAGRIDAFWSHDIGTWNAAASIVLLRESGALVHARDGRPALDSRSLLACTPPLFEPFLSLLAEP